MRDNAESKDKTYNDELYKSVQNDNILLIDFT